MKCPKCNIGMMLQYTRTDHGDDYAVWACSNCQYGLTTLNGKEVPWDYLCAFCHEHYFHIQTDDHTPLAELICPKCAKKMGIEVQTHPDEPEDEENVAFGC